MVGKRHDSGVSLPWQAGPESHYSRCAGKHTDAMIDCDRPSFCHSRNKFLSFQRSPGKNPHFLPTGKTLVDLTGPVRRDEWESEWGFGGEFAGLCGKSRPSGQRGQDGGREPACLLPCLRLQRNETLAKNRKHGSPVPRAAQAAQSYRQQQEPVAGLQVWIHALPEPERGRMS